MADEEYNKRLESLQQYVPFLEKMITQLKDPTKPNREPQLAKITSLHSMITEKKKLKLTTLTKCEEVILQLVSKAKSKTHTQVSLEERPACLSIKTSESPVVSKVNDQAQLAVVERPASPSYTPPKKPIKFSIFPKQKEVVHSVGKISQSIKDPATKVFVEKPSVFDRLGTRAFYQSKPKMSFDEALASFREKLKSQGISVSDGNKLKLRKSPLSIAVATSDKNEETKETEEDERPEEKERVSESEEKDDRVKHIDRPEFRKGSEEQKEGPLYIKTFEEKQDSKKEKSRSRATSEDRENLKKSTRYSDYKERRKHRDASERRSRSYEKYRERAKYIKSSEEREPLKRKQIYDKRRKFRGTSEQTDDSDSSIIGDQYLENRRFKKSSEEKEDLKNRYSYKNRQRHRQTTEKKDSKYDRNYDKYKARRKFRDTSEETEESKTSPTRDKYKENRKSKKSSEEREDSKSYDKQKKLKSRATSEERDNIKSRSYDKYAERRRIKEERRRSVYSRYIYKSSRRETDRNSWTETRHKIKIRTENTSNKYNQIMSDYKRHERSRLEASERRKGLSVPELARIKLKYLWVNPDLKTRAKATPVTENVKLEDIPLPVQAAEENVTNPAVSDVSESSMCDVDITPVDMVLSPVHQDDNICIESTITTSLPFPFPTESIKSESSTETSSNHTNPNAINISIPNATIELSSQNNSYWNYFGNSDEQDTLQNTYGELQQLDYYPQGSVPIRTTFIHQGPPVLSPQHNVSHRSQQTSNRNEFRVLREFTKQSSNTSSQQDHRPSDSVATHVEDVAVKREEVAVVSQSEVSTVSQPEIATLAQPEIATVAQPEVATVAQPEVAVVSQSEVASVAQSDESSLKHNDLQELNEDEKQMEIINKFLKKLLENEHTRAAASVFIENVSSSLDDENLKKAVNTVMSPKKPSKANKGRIINRKLVLDDDDEDCSKEMPKKKNSKPVIHDDDTDEEVTSTVHDDRKPSASKKKKSELDLLHEDLRGMFIHDGMLTSTGRRMCCLLKDDADSDTKSSGQPDRRTRSLTKKFDMKSSENQQQLRILRSARVVIKAQDNLDKRKATSKSQDTDEDEYFPSIRRSRKPRYIEDSEDEHSPKRSQKTCTEEKVKKGKHPLSRSKKSLKKYEDKDSEVEVIKTKYIDSDSEDEVIKKREYPLRQSNKISWNYAEDDSDDGRTEGKKSKGRGEEYSLRQSGKISWTYAEENSDNDEDSEQREEYSLRRSNKVPKSYVEIDSDDERIKMKKASSESKALPKESPKKTCGENVKGKVNSSKSESPKKTCGENVKGKVNSSKSESPKKKQEQKAKVEEKTSSPHKIIRRKKVSQWALGVIPKFKKKKKEQSEKPKSVGMEETETIELVEPDKNYCAPKSTSHIVCKLCPFKGRVIAQHYKQKHPEYEVLCSRLQPEQAEKAIEVSIKQKLEQSEDYVLKRSLKYPFQCCFCNLKMNTTVSFFYDHISSHTGEFRHICSECPYGCSGSKALRLHYQKVHNKPRDNKPIIKHIGTEVYGYLCIECNYVQMNRRSVEDHVNIYHLGEGRKIMKINLSSIAIPKRQNKKPPKKQLHQLNKKTTDISKGKRKLQRTQNNSGKNNEELPMKKRKVEDEAEAITLLSLLENFEKNNKRMNTDLREEFAKHNETKIIANTKENMGELQKAPETREVTVSMKKCQSLTLSQLLSEKQIKQEHEKIEDNVDVKQLQNEKQIYHEKGPTEIKKKKASNSGQLPITKHIKQEKQIKLSESMKKKWQSLNLDELTIKVLKKGDTCASEGSDGTPNDVLSTLHTTADLDKTEPLENEEMELDNDLHSEISSKSSNEEETKSPTEKVKKIDMSVFTCKTDLEKENEKINQERLQKMMQLNETIKKKRQSFSIVEQLSSRLLQESKATLEEKIPKIELPLSERVHSQESTPSCSTSPLIPQKVTVPNKGNATIVMSAGFFDVFKNKNELEFVCRMSPCSFASKYQDTFVTHLNNEHGKINDEYKISECSACQGKLIQNPETPFLKNFFIHMVEKHLNMNDTECEENVSKQKTTNSSVTEDGGNVMRAGLLDIIKGTNTLKYVCRVVFCTFTSKYRNDFISHWTEEHSNFRMTQCRLCGSEVAASAGNNVVLSLFAHLDEEHLGVKSRKLQASSHSVEISEVISIDDDPTPPPSPAGQQNFVIESVVSLAEEAEPETADTERSEDPEPTEDSPPFIIGDVVSLADNVESSGTSSKEKTDLVIQKVASVFEKPAPSPEQDKPSFVIENVVSLAAKPKAYKSESALKVFLEHPMEIYKCPQFYCHFFCESRNFFDMHVKAHAIPNNKMVCCVYCDVKVHAHNISSHIDTYHQNCLYSCSQCLYRALRKEYVMVHMKLKHKKVSQIISLPKPLKIYTSQVKSFALNETCHAYRCGHNGCHAEFLFQSDFTIHLTNAHDGAMVCGYVQKQSSCPYRCTKADSMIDHWKGHNCYSYHCLICQVGSMELYTMLEHYSFSHPNRRPNIVDRRRGPANEVHGYNGRAFAKIKYVTNEIFSSLGVRHYNIVSANSENHEVIQIEDDGDKTINKGNVGEEVLLEKFGTMCEPSEKELKCPICVHFKTKKISHFIYHLLLELKCHRFKCKSCDYSCITYGTMVIHCQEDHKLNTTSNMTESPIDEMVQYWIELVINYQAKAITSNFSLERGEESRSAVRTVQCDFCRKWFRNMETLQEHELYHWAELVYICGLCRVRRPTLNETLQHVRIAHSGADCSVARIPSVTKIISTWKSLTSSLSHLKDESVTGFRRVQGSSDGQVLILPSSTLGQQDAVLYACLRCSATVKSVEMLQKHNVECHNGKIDNFKCKVLTKSKAEVMLLMFVLP